MDGKIFITTSLEGLQIKISSKEDLHNLYTIQSLSEVQRLQGSQWKLEPSDWSLPTSGLKPLTLLSAYFSRLSSWSCLLLLFFHLLLSFSCHILYKITQKKTTKLASTSVFDNRHVFNDRNIRKDSNQKCQSWFGPCSGKTETHLWQATRRKQPYYTQLHVVTILRDQLYRRCHSTDHWRLAKNREGIFSSCPICHKLNT